MNHSEVVQVTIRLPIDLKQWLDDRAALYRSSQSSETIRILRAAKEQHEKADQRASTTRAKAEPA
jgi:hypothetical protein